jgi:hypothetical protein
LDSEFGEDRFDVIAQGVRGDVQMGGDLVGARPAHQQFGHLALAGTESVQAEQQRGELGWRGRRE